MSSINPVGRSMNGIKTIETASLIFTDDNSSLNTSAGIVSAQANSTTALNGKINSVGFNTSNGVLTLTKEDGNTLTKDLDGRYLESVEVADIPDLPASKIVSGTLGTARIPDLNASKITAGTLGDARIPNLNASKINDGTLGTARIPDLNASKITAGTLGDARIPNLNASKINDGTLATARIPDLPYVSVGTSGTHTDETIFGVKTFNEFPVKSGTGTALDPTADNQFATKQYVDDNGGGGSGDAVLSAGTSGSEQTFTGFNKFNEELKLGGDLIFTEQGGQNMTFSNTSSTNTSSISQNTNRNWIYQNISTGGTTNNQFNQIGVLNDTGITNQIFQEKAQINNIIQDGVNNNFTQRDGTATITQEGGTATITQEGVNSIISTQGKIGINTTNPTFPLHIKDGTTGMGNTKIFTYFRHYSLSIGRGAGWANTRFSIFADYTIMSATFTGASDVRIKKDIMDLSSALPLIEQIKPRTYKYKDPKRGDKMAYGFIAQELEEVIPELIQTTQNKIPNIMKTADVIDGVFTLKEATDLQVGDKIDIYDEDDKELNVKITEIISDKSFKTAVDVELKDKYFIYGKYVDDFKGIEHNGLLPIMLKAIQELNARVKELEATLK